MRPALVAVSECLPAPALDGGRIRFGNVLAALARRFDVTLLAFDDGSASAQERSGLRRLCREVRTVQISRGAIRRNIARGLLTSVPLNVAAYASREMAASAAPACFSAGAVWVNRLRMWPFVPALCRAKAALDLTDSLARFAGSLSSAGAPWLHRLYGRLEAPRLLAYETEAVRTAGAAFCASPVDARHLSDRAGRKVHLLPNALSASRLSRTARRTRAAGAGVHALFVGSLRYAPNRWGLRWVLDEVWPRVCEARPEARLTVVSGAAGDFAPALRAGARVVAHARDMASLYREASVALVPGRTLGGTRQKLLEAVGQGVPVVSTSAGAEGLPFRDGEHILIADDPASFARAAIESSSGPRAVRRASAARRLLARTLTWEKVLPTAVAIVLRLSRAEA